MAIVAKLLALLPLILLLLLTVTAGIAYARITSLSLPIPKALALLTLVLPLITGVSTHGTSVLVRKARKQEQAQLALPLLAVIGFQVIYDTIVATLSLTHIIPPSNLLCGLETRWAQLFRAKNENAIKAIQDALSCCGFNSVKDRGWPFPPAKATACKDIFQRNTSCAGVWREAEQITAGLLLLVAIVCFLVKVLSIISILTNSTWPHPRWAIIDVSHEDIDENERATSTRRIEGGNQASEYRDELVVEGEPGLIEAPHADQQPRIQPSHLVDHGNEWRD